MKWVLALFLLFFLACNKKIDSICDLAPLYQKAPYHIGVAVDVSKLQTNNTYRALVIDQFNSLTPENIFKFEYVHPGENTYDWTDCDYLVNFAKRYGKRLNGHTLVWHSQLPGWIYTFAGNWDDMLHDHITQVVGRYGAAIQAWDVVNEALNEDGTLRNSIWFQRIGTGYIEKAFAYANNANPNALLFYNDYNLESNPVKLDAAIRLCTQMKLQGIRVDGIGMQMHINGDYPTFTAIMSAAKKVADAGFLVHFSELDMSMNQNRDKQSFSAKDLQNQAARYYGVFDIYNQLDASKQYGITFWGVSDADSWIAQGRNDIPLLFDDQYKFKPAYCACKSSFK